MKLTVYFLSIFCSLYFGVAFCAAAELDVVTPNSELECLFSPVPVTDNWIHEMSLRFAESESRLTEVEAQLKSQQQIQQEIQQASYDETPVPAVPPVGNVPTLDQEILDRLATMEENWAKLQESEAKKKSDALKKPTFKVGGRIHWDHWNFSESSPGIDNFEHPGPGPQTGTDPEDLWAFRRIRMEFSGDILENMFWRMQLDFAELEDAAIKDVYIGFSELPHNQKLYLGHQKRPIGLDHWNSSRYNIFLERPLVVEAVNEDARRMGIMMHGYTDDESLNWQYGIATLENSAGDRSNRSDAGQYSLHFRTSGTPWYDESSGGRGYLHLGFAGMFANPDGDADPGVTDNNEGRFRTRMAQRSERRWMDTGRIPGANWYEVAALEMMLNVGACQWTTEYMNIWMQRDMTTPGTGPDLHFNGFYTQFSYFLTGEYIPVNREVGQIGRIKPFENFFLVDKCCGGRGRGWGAWQIAGRYDYLDISDADINGGVGNMATFGMNWYWTAYSRMQFNLIYSDIKDHAPVNGFTGGTSLTAGVRFGADF